MTKREEFEELFNKLNNENKKQTVEKILKELNTKENLERKI